MQVENRTSVAIVLSCQSVF